MEDQNTPTDQLEAENNVEEQNIISLNKFIFLSIITFGLYDIWWMYKAWRFFQQKEQSDIKPACRALFGIFFFISLCDKIVDFSKEKEYSGSYSSILLFLGYFISTLAAYLDEPVWLFVSVSSVVFLIPPFKALNFAKQHSTEFVVIEQESFNGRQITLVVIGIIFWILFLLALSVK